jgi:hypothetical protein
MKGKRPQPESTKPFESRKYAADLLKFDIDIPGSFIEGSIFSISPRDNKYTVDIRRDSKAKAAYLDVYIDEKLKKRLEILINDRLRISLQGAQFLPHTAPSRLPVILRFREGITVLLVSRAGPQREKEKLFHIWPGQSEHYYTSTCMNRDFFFLVHVDATSSKSKKRKMNCDTSDLGWFSTPPPGDAHSGLEQSSLGLQTPTPSGSNTTSPTHTNHPEITDDAEPSTVTEAFQTLRKLPHATGQCQGAATYAYRTAPSHENTPVDLAILNAPSGAGSSAAVLPMPRDTSSETDGKPILPCQGSSEHREKSNRKKKRGELKRHAASAAASSSMITEASSMRADVTPTTPTTDGISDTHADTCGGDGRQTELEDVAMLIDPSPEQHTDIKSGGPRARLAEDVDSTGKGASETEPNGDDPALGMRAGLIVNGVSTSPRGHIVTFSMNLLVVAVHRSL